MNMHVPQSLPAIAEIMVNSRCAIHIVSAQKNGPVNGIVQDGCVAAYLMSMTWNDGSYTMVSKKTVYNVYKNAEISEERIHDLILRAKEFYPEYITHTTNDVTPNKCDNENIKWDFADEIPGGLMISIVFPANFEYSKHLSSPESPVINKPSVEIKDGIFLPNSAPLCKRSIGGKNNSCVHYLWKRSPDMALCFLSDVQQITDHWLPTHGFSLGIQDCFATSEQDVANALIETRVKVNHILSKTDIDENRTEVEIMMELNNAMAIGPTLAKNAMSKGERNGFSIMRNSGAKGSIINLSQIAAFVGHQDLQGKRMPNHLTHGTRWLPCFLSGDKSQEARGWVENNYVRGLTPVEYYAHSTAGRKGIINTALKSVTGETPIIIIDENYQSKYVLIGDWIDELLEKNIKNVKNYTEREMELLDVSEYNMKIPTTDEKGNVSWGLIKNITRHNPGKELFRIVTRGGRYVTVTESKSLLIWSFDDQAFIRMDSSMVKVGDYVPSTLNLLQPVDIKMCTHINPRFELNNNTGLFLGIFLAKGHTTDNEIFVEFVSENIVKFVYMWFIDYGVTNIQMRETQEVGYRYNHCISGNSIELAKLLTKLTGDDVYNRHVPDVAFTASSEFILSLIYGLVKNSGSFSTAIILSSNSERLNVGVNMLLTRFGIVGMIQLEHLMILGKSSEKFKHLMNTHADMMMTCNPATVSYNVDQQNDVILDEIISIELIKVEDYAEKYPQYKSKVYDLTVPSTLNFGLANGLHVVDTAETGYIQKRIARKIEDSKVFIDGTVRDSNEKIISFAYGDDGMDAKKLISVKGLNSPFFVDVISLAQQLNSDARRSKEVEITDKPRKLNESEINILLSLISFSGIKSTVIDRITENARNNLLKIIGRNDVLIYECKVSQFVVSIVEYYNTSKIPYGSMIGHIAATSIGEPTTQMVLNSVAYDTEIIILDNNKCVATVVKIGQYIDNLMNNNKDVKQITQNKKTSEYLEIIGSADICIPTVNNKGETSWGDITAVTRHPPHGNLYEIKTRSGRSVIVSKSKSLLVWNEEMDQFIHTSCTKVKIGDYVPTMENICDPYDVINVINLRKYLSPTEWVYSTDLNYAYSKWLKFKRFPSGWWSEKNGTKFTLPYDRGDSAMRRAKQTNYENGLIYPLCSSHCVTKFPEMLPLDIDTGFIIGIYLADGCVTDTFTSITKDDSMILDRIIAWCKLYSIGYHITKSENKNVAGMSTSIILHSVLLARLLKKWVGTGSSNKVVPPEAFNSNLEFVKGILNGYISGDGTVGKKKHNIIVSSASDTLIRGINMLCTRVSIFGVMARTQLKSNNLGTLNIKPSFTLRISNCWATKFACNIGSTHSKKKDRMANILHTGTGYAFSKISNDCILDPIVSITEIKEDLHPNVYDLTVPSTLNFCLFNGLGVADTFQACGVGGKDASTGVPRFKQLINTTKTKDQKKSGCIVYFTHALLTDNTDLIVRLENENKKEISDTQREENTSTILGARKSSYEFLQNLRKDFEETYVNQFLVNYELRYTNDDCKSSPISLITYKKYKEEWWHKLSKSNKKFANNKHDIPPTSWVITLQFNVEKLYNHRIELDDIAHEIEIKSSYTFVCLVSPNILGRIEVYLDFDVLKPHFMSKLDAKNIQIENESESTVRSFLNKDNVDFYICRDIAMDLLKKTQISGIKGITKTYPKEILKTHEFIMETDGINFYDIINMEGVDPNRTICDDMHILNSTLCVEAARRFIFNDITRVISFDGTYVNPRHISTLADSITINGTLTAASRDGISRDVGPNAKVMFEKNIDNAVTASAFTERDNMVSLASSVMYGKLANAGSGMVNVRNKEKISNPINYIKETSKKYIIGNSKPFVKVTSGDYILI